MVPNDRIRCAWPGNDPLYVAYHDDEWGVPEHDDQKLFEKLILDGAQAGLSWITILRKRDGYRKAFDQFDAEKIGRYSEKKIERLLQDPGIVRNRLKVNSAVTNAQAYLRLQEEGQAFNDFLWQFTDGRTIQNQWTELKQLPASTPESDAMSKALKKRGFKFVGSTICYAFMQAIGMVNDHAVHCFRHEECRNMAKKQEASAVQISNAG
ncbi:MAG TPA: DNA-3-methyladenine glycosylase I [Candidatus Kapabacteria bacterium]|nr:DNA-3-methyladenine glycosylase I [Candidatus Kapabacteria bacterium]